MKQLALLRSRKFWPLFWTQFLGAFNDNLFKNALVMLVTFRSLSVAGLAADQVVMLSGGVFILPFFLFSASAGQLADKLRKSDLMRRVKLAEIPIMGLAAVGFWTDSPGLLLGVLFLMGLQSSVFGPAKYSVLPEVLDADELIGGNALVEMGTFVAILLGTIAGGVAIAAGERGPSFAAMAVVCVAVAGYVCSRRILPTPPGDPGLRFDYNPVRPTWQTLSITRRNRPVFLSILGISWFWFFGASFMVLLPSYGKDVLGGDENTVTTYLALFCVGISLGSMMCERLSRRRLELGLVPLGSIGMTVFAADLFLVGVPPMPFDATGTLDLAAFFTAPGRIRVGVDLFMVAVFGGLYTVPLYTMMQQRSPEHIRARVIAGNNILNACFMVVSSIMLLGLSALGAGKPEVFLTLAVLNAIVSVFIYTVIPEFMLRFWVWLATCLLYRLRILGAKRLPEHGAAVIVVNHTSWLDWMIVASISGRPVRFVIDRAHLRSGLVRRLLRDAKAIPIASASEDADVLAAAFDQIAAELADGELVCLFPEGERTADGQLGPFRRGVEAIVARTPVPVIPIGIHGLWGSRFSRCPADDAARRALRWRRVDVRVGEPIAPEQVTADQLRASVAALCG